MNDAYRQAQHNALYGAGQGLVAPDPRLPPFEEPQPAKKMYLYICDDECAVTANNANTSRLALLRRATAEDLEKMGFVRKNG